MRKFMMLSLLAVLLFVPVACGGTDTVDEEAVVDTAAEVVMEDEAVGEADAVEETEEEAVEDAEADTEDVDEEGDVDEEEDMDEEGDEDEDMGDEDSHMAMLDTAMDLGLIAQDDADLFLRVHMVLDEQGEMDEEVMETVDDDAKKLLQRTRTDAAVAAGVLSQEDADAFTAIHDLLIDNGLMED